MFTQKETLVSAFLCTSKPFRRKLLSFLNFPLVLTFLQLKFLFFNIFTSKSNKKEKKKIVSVQNGGHASTNVGGM